MYTANPESVCNFEKYGNIEMEIKRADLSFLINKVKTKLNV
jgi:hypothetical protein